VIKTILKPTKKNVQQGFKERLGLIIDQPKQGYGSSNDGNTARRFFSNYSISAEITGVDEELIRRIYIILQAMSCGFQIDVQKFQIYTEETARKFGNYIHGFICPRQCTKFSFMATKL
jgi:hypothetical protein